MHPGSQMQLTSYNPSLGVTQSWYFCKTSSQHGNKIFHFLSRVPWLQAPCNKSHHSLLCALAPKSKWSLLDCFGAQMHHVGWLKGPLLRNVHILGNKVRYSSLPTGWKEEAYVHMHYCQWNPIWHKQGQSRGCMWQWLYLGPQWVCIPEPAWVVSLQP